MSLNLNPRHLDCFVSPPLGLWELSLRRHAIVNNLVDELSAGDIQQFSASFVRVHVEPDSSLRRSLLKIDSGTRTSTICSSIHSGVSFVCGQPSSLVSVNVTQRM